MKSYGFLFWAYAVVWLGLAGYLFYLFRRIRKVEERIRRLDDETES